MTKTQTKAVLQARIDSLWRQRKQAMDEMESQKQNPQVARMIERNKGYIMALEDITDICYSNKIF